MSDTKERWINKTVAYIGKRFSRNGKLLMGFVYADNLDGDPMLYSTKHAVRYPLGALINCKVTKGERMDFASFDITDDYVSDHYVEQWSAEDAVARRAASNESARKKAIKEHRTAWLDALEPLRTKYRYASLPQKRALRELLLEWLDT